MSVINRLLDLFMAKKKNRALFINIFTFCFLLVALVFFSSLMLMFLAPPDSAGWKSYQVIAYTDIEEDSLISELNALGFSDFITESRQKVSISNFSKTKEYGLKQALETLDKEDPRLDPYIKWLPSMFSAKTRDKDYSLMYIGTKLSAPAFFIKINPLLRKYKGNILLPFFNRIVRLTSVLIFILAALPIILKAKKIRIWIILSSAAWTLALWTAGFRVFVFAVTAIAAFVLLADELTPLLEDRLMWNSKKKQSWSVYLKAGLLLSVFTVMSFTDGLFFMSLSLLVVHAVIVSLVFIRLRIKRIKSVHRVFMPVKIKKSGFAGLFETRYSSAIAILFVAGIAGFFISHMLAVNKGNYMELPVPLVQKTDNTGENKKEPFNLYIAHRAYQDGFMFNFPFKVPKKGERIELPFYSINGTDVTEKEKVMLSYDEKWFDRIMTVSSDNIAKLFIDNSSVYVDVAGTSSFVSTASIWSLAVLLLLLPFCWKLIKAYLTFNFRYVMRAEVYKERRRAAA